MLFTFGCFEVTLHNFDFKQTLRSSLLHAVASLHTTSRPNRYYFLSNCSLLCLDADNRVSYIISKPKYYVFCRETLLNDYNNVLFGWQSVRNPEPHSVSFIDSVFAHFYRSCTCAPVCPMPVDPYSSPNTKTMKKIYYAKRATRHKLRPKRHWHI